MLAMTIPEGAYVDVDGSCRVWVVSLRADGIRLGFEADKSVSILRDNAKVRHPQVDDEADRDRTRQQVNESKGAD